MGIVYATDVEDRGQATDGSQPVCFGEHEGIMDTDGQEINTFLFYVPKVKIKYTNKQYRNTELFKDDIH